MDATAASFVRAAPVATTPTKQSAVSSDKRLSAAPSLTTPFFISPLSTKSQSRQRFASAKLAINSSAATSAASMATAPRTGGLIEPDGGVLVDLHVSEQEKDSKKAEAATLPKIQLVLVDLQWVHTVAEGWASPLTGFMRQNEYLQSLHFNCLRLPDGTFTNMSLPIVLAIDDEKKQSLSGVNAVTLVGPDGNDVAILRKYVTGLNFLVCPWISTFWIPFDRYGLASNENLRAKVMFRSLRALFVALTLRSMPV